MNGPVLCLTSCSWAIANSEDTPATGPDCNCWFTPLLQYTAPTPTTHPVCLNPTSQFFVKAYPFTSTLQSLLDILHALSPSLNLKTLCPDKKTYLIQCSHMQHSDTVTFLERFDKRFFKISPHEVQGWTQKRHKLFFFLRNCSEKKFHVTNLQLYKVQSLNFFCTIIIMHMSTLGR